MLQNTTDYEFQMSLKSMGPIQIHKGAFNSTADYVLSLMANTTEVLKIKLTCAVNFTMV